MNEIVRMQKYLSNSIGVCVDVGGKLGPVKLGGHLNYNHSVGKQEGENSSTSDTND